ncbi:pseudouridine synthase [Palleronia sediminis]|uniref:Pseudouridine synthase n=1 Tax=Palleronia sediminis TaxID=2547833 RepID=A0A4R6AQX9_9RHOB|nr:hemolysin XhlA family protein [Palleronia sediminis]TDL84123.1 pseudouridine synthase [Palleronia sediminis]
MSEARLTELERRIGALEMRGAVDEVHRVNVEQRLGAIEDTLKWLVRLVLGAVILGGIGYGLGGGLMPP